MTTTQVTLDAPESELRIAITESLVESIRTAEGSDIPFSHLYFRQLLPPAVYEWILRNPLERASFEDLHHRDALRGDGTSTRATRGIDREEIRDLPEPTARIWRAIHDALTSLDVRRALFNRLQTDLGHRFDLAPEELDDLDSTPLAFLVRDEVGYWIAPHKDVERKHVTMQIYLTEDERQRSLGTTIYRELWGPRILNALKRISRILPRRWRYRLFVAEARTFDFIPNTGYAFAVSHKSWHGRRMVSERDQTRRSMMLVFYDPSAKELTRAGARY